MAAERTSGALRLFAVVTTVFLEGCTPSCNGNCFDPDDPCPNDMVTDESGCLWDRCSGPFTGNLIPCWFAEPGLKVGELILAGSRAQHLAYSRILDESRLHPMGEMWLYDLESRAHTRLSEEGRMCYMLGAQGDRVGWVEVENYGPGFQYWDAVFLIHVKDIVTGAEWRFPIPEKTKPISFSFSGDFLVVNRLWEQMCDGYLENFRDVWLYDMQTGEKSLVAGEFGKPCASGARIHGNRIAYWKHWGCCGQEDLKYQIWERDVVTGVDRLVVDTGENVAPIDASFLYGFDGKWEVVWLYSHVRAYDLDTGESKEVTRCSIGDCHLAVGDGLVAYERQGEDGFVQRQSYVAELATGRKLKLTNLRPYFDGSVPWSMSGHRLLWGESRGKLTMDDCGNTRDTDGRTELWFWKDIEF